jgi:two-component system sensor histidine kinase QseC
VSENNNHLPFQKKVSIRRFLSLCIVGIITFIIAILGGLNYIQIKKQNERLFRMQMENNAHIIDSFISLSLYDSSLNNLSNWLKNPSSLQTNNIQNRIRPITAVFYNPNNDAFSFQVYNVVNKIVVLRSSNAPESAIYTKGIGFSKQKFTQNGKQYEWYSFALNSHHKPYRIIIFVNSKFQENTFLDIFENSLWDLLILYVIISILSLVFVKIALNPLSQITKNLAKRDPRKLKPLKVQKAPEEIVPLLNELNILFQKFTDALNRERRFTADAAHELKTPLAVLKTQAEVALNTDNINDIKIRIKHIISSTDQYFHIINQLLTLTKLEPEQELPDKKVFNLNTVIEDWVGKLAPRAIDKEIEIEFIAHNEDILINGSDTFIGILIRNLVDNAIQYTPLFGHIKIISKIKGQKVEIQVIDTGIGVSQEKLKRIFDRFYRVSGTNVKGSGLGLSIVKEIIRLHNGSISAQMPSSGEGLKVTILLPCITHE